MHDIYWFIYDIWHNKQENNLIKLWQGSKTGKQNTSSEMKYDKVIEARKNIRREFWKRLAKLIWPDTKWNGSFNKVGRRLANEKYLGFETKVTGIHSKIREKIERQGKKFFKIMFFYL